MMDATGRVACFPLEESRGGWRFPDSFHRTEMR